MRVAAGRLNRRARATLALAALVLAACGGGKSSSSAPTTISTTTTMTADLAAQACPELAGGDATPEVIDDLRSSRDPRIAEAARAYEEADDPFDGQVDGGVVRALEELLHACEAAGYVPQ